MSPKNIKYTILAIAMLFFAFTLYHAPWLAPAPTGAPTLLAMQPADIPRDTYGCITDAQAGYGAAPLHAETRMLQSATGYGAQAMVINSEMVDGAPVLPRVLPFICPADAARPRAPLAQALSAVSKPVQYIRVNGAAHAAAIIATLPQDTISRIYFGDARGVAAIKAKIPNAKGFAIADARRCASQYRSSGWYGHIPQICRNGAVLLTLDDLGYTLWGWPNRFLARMKDANTSILIAQNVQGQTITGLQDVTQYGAIANSFNGVIIVDNIAELGPALQR